MSALLTYMSFLMSSSNGTSYTSICPIKDYPDFLNSINTIDVTNLQQDAHTYIKGLKDNGGGDMPFTCNYNVTDYQNAKALDDGQEHYLAIYFGGTETGGSVTPTGVDGIWKFKGYVSVGIVGKGADDAREMQIHVVPTTDFTFSVGSSA